MKHDWSKIPSGFDWVAMDQNGVWYLYAERPQLFHGQWASFCRLERYLFPPADVTVHWMETLSYRHGAFPNAPGTAPGPAAPRPLPTTASILESIRAACS